MFSFLLFWSICCLIVFFLSTGISSTGSKSFYLVQKLWISRKGSEKEEEKEHRKWTDLPDELVELIIEYLCLRDYLQLRKICSPWKNIVTKALAHKHCFPLVVLISKKGTITEQSFYSLKAKHEHPEISRFHSCHGSIEGWMIMNNRTNDTLSFFFFNPVTNRRISVKSQLHLSDPLIEAFGRPCMGKMVSSSKPNCYNSDYFLAGIFCKNNIAYYRRLGKSWNMIETGNDSSGGFDVEIVGSKLYVIVKNSMSTMLVYDLKDSGNGSPTPKVLALPQTEMPRRIENPPFFSFSGVMRHLAKHETLEQLFLIYVTWSRSYKRNMFSEDRYPLEITTVDVFKLDINKKPIQWIKCESLDDNVIFVGTGNSMVISRASLINQDSIGENSVYCALSLEYPTSTWTEVRLGIKHLTDSDVKYFSVEEPVYRVLFPCWLRPSL